ncbi:MAG: hypothetical protein ABTQ32_30210 [Myxococcaceae bacterium]
MSWSAVFLAVVLVASPPPRRFNAEPIGFGVGGLVAAGLGVWRLTVADQLYRRLGMVSSTATSAQEAALLLNTAQRLVVEGKRETFAGGALLFVGGAVALASALWFFVEGPSTRDWLVSVGPQGVSVATKF